MDKYKVAQLTVSQLIASVQKGDIAIPELQRPFVWPSTKVRDLMDSLYNGYPVGYLITWQSVGAKLKGGQTAKYQHILIDGQQRITALRAAVAGLPVIDKHYKQVRIAIAFNPLKNQFETATPLIRNNPQWIADISTYFNSESPYSFVNGYIKRNPAGDPGVIEKNIQRLGAIQNAQIGTIALDGELDVETVAEIFIRINSKGVPLSSADFIMSKIASYGDRGRNLRKLIDYFCHLSVAPHAYSDIRQNDTEFAQTNYFKLIEWLKNESGDLYDPEYSDVIRVTGLVGFSRGKASSIVSRLSGRDPESRVVDESLIPEAYGRLESALEQIVKKYNFQNFIMLVKSAGYISPDMVSAKNALNFAYALYLRLHGDNSCSDGEVKRIVRRWLVMSLLTGRHSGSFESTWEADIRHIGEVGAAKYLRQIEESELSDSYWTVTLPQNLATTSTASPYFQTFQAAQVVMGTKGFLSEKLTVGSMIQQSGDIHHLFPKAFLETYGYPDRNDYNQVANYAKTETAINIHIGKREPAEYMREVNDQVHTGVITIGDIRDDATLATNLVANAIPDGFSALTVQDYPEFLVARRALMAQTIRRFYDQL